MTHLRRTIRTLDDNAALAWVRQLVPDGIEQLHRFSPQGLSVTRVGTTGSVAVHTWPELGVATVDAYGTAVAALESMPREDLCPS